MKNAMITITIQAPGELLTVLRLFAKAQWWHWIGKIDTGETGRVKIAEQWKLVADDIDRQLLEHHIILADNLSKELDHATKHTKETE